MQNALTSSHDAAIEIRLMSDRLCSLSFELSDEDVCGDLKNISMFLNEVAKRLAVCSVRERIEVEVENSFGGQGNGSNQLRIDEKRD